MPEIRSFFAFAKHAPADLQKQVSQLNDLLWLRFCDNLPVVVSISGPFGTGKTTLARVVVNMLNSEWNEDHRYDFADGEYHLETLLKVFTEHPSHSDRYKCLILQNTQLLTAKQTARLQGFLQELPPLCAVVLTNPQPLPFVELSDRYLSVHIPNWSPPAII